MMDAFLTGSLVYGKAGPTSDIDLVIKCNEETRAVLERECDTYENEDITICRYGKLNIIITTSDEEYATWKYGTKTLIMNKIKWKRPVTKLEAKDRFVGLLLSAGLADRKVSE